MKYAEYLVIAVGKTTKFLVFKKHFFWELKVLVL